MIYFNHIIMVFRLSPFTHSFDNIYNGNALLLFFLTCGTEFIVLNSVVSPEVAVLHGTETGMHTFLKIWLLLTFMALYFYYFAPSFILIIFVAFQILENVCK